MVFLVGAAASLGAFVVAYQLTDGPTFETRLESGLRAATAAAVPIAALLGWSRLELSRREHHLGEDRDLTERYSRSIEQIGSDDKFVRLGGIYALERFALDAARRGQAREHDWRMALDVLATLARELDDDPIAGVATGTDGTELVDPRAPLAAIEAVRVLGRFTERSARADLTMAADLHRLRAHGTDLAGADLAGADLSAATLRRAILRDADMTGANLSGACLTGADLRAADMSRTDLRDADLTAANLAGANLVNADLTGADITGTQFLGHRQVREPLPGSPEAQARGGSIAPIGATRKVTKDIPADLTGADLAETTYDDTTTWPPGFEPHQTDRSTSLRTTT